MVERPIQLTLIWGDCLEEMKKIPDKSVDMVLTDPPYGTTACKWDTVVPFGPMWEQLHRVTKDNGAICLFGSEPFSSALRMSNIKRFKYDWVWHKSNPSNFATANKRPMSYHEIISTFYSKQPRYNKQMITRLSRVVERHKRNGTKGKTSKSDHIGLEQEKDYATKYDPDKKNPGTIIYCNSVSNFSKIKSHPTQKPVALLEYLIKTYTLEGETVLDFTMGSGSTGVACKNLNRNFIGIEKEKKYFDIAKSRIENHMPEQQTALAV